MVIWEDKFYEGSKQNNRKSDLREAIKTTMLKIEPDEVKKEWTK